MTLAEARTAIQQRGYAIDTAGAQDEFIKSVARRVWRSRRWPFREATATAALTAGTPNYALTAWATDVADIDGVRIEFGTEYDDLEYLPAQQFRDLEQIDRANQIPENWTRFAEELRFYPRPDRAYTARLDYLKAVPAFADNTALPGPADFHDVYVWGALKDLSLRERDSGSYQVAAVEYAGRLQEMVAAHGIQQRQSARRVVKSGFFDDEVW